MGEPVTIFEPRPAQWRLFEQLQRFNVIVCHRGFGKSYLAVNILIRQALKKPGTSYAYLTDTYQHVADIAWRNILKRCLAPAAAAGHVKFWESDLRASFANGSEIKLYGVDTRPEALRGLHLDGVVFDEYALIPPAVWETIVFPTLLRKHGGAIFIGTPQGRNHFYSLYKHAKELPDWYAATIRADESGVYTPEEIQLAKATQTPEQFAQEYMCSFETAIAGAYYARELAAARSAGRVCQVAWQPTAPVDTWWDLGNVDATVILFTQQIGTELHLIDYAEDAHKDLAWYAKLIQERPYLYGRHHLPHDGGHERLEAGGRSIETQLRGLLHQRTPITVHPKNDPLSGIHQARLLFPRLWFDSVKVERLLDCLAYYHAKQDAKHSVERPEPEHDWSSHAADAFRLMAVSQRDLSRDPLQRAQPARIEFNPFTVGHR